MRKALFFFFFGLGLASSLQACGSAEELGCTSDLECRGGRICQQGVCVAPSQNNANNANNVNNANNQNNANNTNNANNANNTNNSNNQNNQNNMPMYTCELVCERLASCFEDTPDDCVKQCEESNPPQELLMCLGTVQSCDEIEDCEDIPLAGPQISVLPEFIEFATQPGRRVTQDLLIENLGDEPLVVSALALSEGARDGFAGFSISERFTNSDFTIEPFSAVNVPVFFTPPGAGVYKNRIIVRSNDPDPADRAISVEMVAFVEDDPINEPCVEVSPDSLNFQTRSGQVVDETLYIKNCGQSKIELRDVSSSAPRNLSYDRRNTPLPQSIAPFDETKVLVRFFRVSRGQFQGSLTLDMRAYTADGLEIAFPFEIPVTATVR